MASVHEELAAAGIPRARILDAGCGTGRHASALIDRGHEVALLDASAELLAIASERCVSSTSYLGDLCEFASIDRFDAVVCRGVLNDLITDDERASALTVFSEVLRPDGVLVLDVRDAARSAVLDGRTRSVDVELPSGVRLTFTSTPRWTAGRIEVDETYELVDQDGIHSSHAYAFEMRPWSSEELERRLVAVGLDRIEIKSGVGRRTSDRLFVVARKESEE
ncbi:MAG TPA: class I SAM-dependent methyltransferase [Microbacterium sp.]|nr:class I SAM-dependent methyltransferase [Microbacterium sp.]